MYKEYDENGRELTSVEIFNKYERYAKATAKRFIDKDETNRYTFDEVYSVCYNSIWESLCKYKPTKGAKTTTYIIGNCRYAILNMLYEDRNYYTKDKKKLDKPVSSLNVLSDDDSTEEFINVIESTYSDDTDDVEFRDLSISIYKLGCELNGKKIPKQLDRNINIVCDRYNGMDLKQIAKRRDTSVVSVNRIMREFNSYAKEYYKKQ